jgi:hypothetical protein
MIAETKKAAPARTAKSNIERVKSYHKRDNPSSRLKEKIGCLLLCLLTDQQGKDGWKRFDRLLHQFYMGSGVGFHGLQSTNSAQRVSE